MNFYNYFLLLCANKGIKPSPAGEKIGVSRTAVSGWKNGRLPTDSTLQAISEYLKIGENYITILLLFSAVFTLFSNFPELFRCAKFS